MQTRRRRVLWLAAGAVIALTAAAACHQARVLEHYDTIPTHVCPLKEADVNEAVNALQQLQRGWEAGDMAINALLTKKEDLKKEDLKKEDFFGGGPQEADPPEKKNQATLTRAPACAKRLTRLADAERSVYAHYNSAIVGIVEKQTKAIQKMVKAKKDEVKRYKKLKNDLAAL
jgi:hypothetical protein